MSDAPGPAERPLRGSKPICRFYYGSDTDKDVRRLYNDAPHLPIFQLVPGGPFHAFPSKLTQHLEALSAQKERAIAEAAKFDADTPAAPKSAPARSRKPPARVAAAPRQVRRRSRQSESVT